MGLLEPMGRRYLALLESIARSPLLHVQTRLVTGKPWLEVVQEIWRDGDLIICLDDHMAQQFLVWPVSLGRKIFTGLNVPVLILQDIHTWSRSPFQNFIHEISAWVSFTGTIFLFALLQIQIDHFVGGWLGRVVLCLTVIVEFFLIWKINQLFN